MKARKVVVIIPKYRKSPIQFWNGVQVVCLIILGLLPFLVVGFIAIHFIRKYW